MHFWIDKRSHCAYTGRHRVPSSLSAGRARGRVCAGAVGVGVGVGVGRKNMAAPVHRFAAVDCPPRRPHRAPRHYTPPPMPSVHATRRQNEEPTLYVEIPPEPVEPVQPVQVTQVAQPTIASLAAARSVTPDTLLRTAALGLQHTPMMAPHLKFGMLVSFALATVFLAGAKYYFDRQLGREGMGGGSGGGGGVGGEAGVVCAAVACVCGVGCALSVCRAKPLPVLPPDRVSSTAQRHRPPPPEPIDESPSTAAQAGRESAEAPPPYKIAVLMPAREPSPPPPSYSSLS